MNAAGRRYLIEFGTAMFAYSVVVVASVYVVKALGAGPLRYPVAVSPVIPAAFALMAYVRYLRRMDELQRRIQLDALAYSFGATILITFTFGLLESAGLLPRVSWTYVGPLMIALWGLGLAIATRRFA